MFIYLWEIVSFVKSISIYSISLFVIVLNAIFNARKIMMKINKFTKLRCLKIGSLEFTQN
ncbi:unnamed protein product [marine sediment metagenome]|uniref:Uncharacterized protein n=1 Tax=marine sediment metagenome TaxID=412755 RepID=X1IM44_9ZZZZ